MDIRGKSDSLPAAIFPELINLLCLSLKTACFVVDGEIVIEVAGHYSFDALQMRLHPSETQILILSAQTLRLS